jgi:hypothetical protein
VSWVIPDGRWSDHGGQTGDFLGAAWVTAIVNAVGNSWTQSGTGHQCDYWGGNSTTPEPTVIIVVWDDWGGFYDHVPPYNCQTGTCTGYSNSTGQQYVYGFRVPMLVVSAYNKHGSGSFTGYISGACGQSGQPTCPNEQPQDVHDFGSILNFIEYAFGQGGAFLHLPGSLSGTGISPLYFYADVLAPDGPNAPKCTSCPYSLSDFFNFSQSPTAFTTIPLPPILCPDRTSCYNPDYFENYGLYTGQSAQNPDED